MFAELMRIVPRFLKQSKSQEEKSGFLLNFEHSTFLSLAEWARWLEYYVEFLALSRSVMEAGYSVHSCASLYGFA